MGQAGIAPEVAGQHVRSPKTGGVGEGRPVAAGHEHLVADGLDTVPDELDRRLVEPEGAHVAHKGHPATPSP